MSSSQIGEGEKVELELQKRVWNRVFTVSFPLPSQVVISLTARRRCGEDEPTPGLDAEVREIREFPFPARFKR